jgi:peroxiredoxin
MKNILFVFVFILFLLPGCGPAENDLPEMSVQLTDNTPVNMKEVEDKTILVLFQPDCDHCQREAADIEENLVKFEEYQLYFLSNASIPELQQFANTYKLNNAPNVHFGTTPAEYIIQNFGSIPTPSLYIYSKDGKLVNEFKGETPIENILKEL